MTRDETLMKNRKIAREAAEQGIVLLQNTDGCLPLKTDEPIALLGKGIFQYKKGGSGSADVFCKPVADLVTGLSGRFTAIVPESLQEQSVYDDETVTRFSKECSCGIVSISRQAGEGYDRDLKSYCLTPEEDSLLTALDHSTIQKVIVLVNAGGLIHFSQLLAHRCVKAVLMIWQPGMEGGNAVADILSGAETPCGKLNDTIARELADYPSSPYFSRSIHTVDYAEDIYVGYRYFETFAKEKVLYPFGFGLSYTHFQLSEPNFEYQDETARISLRVTNTGNFTGRETVQIYVASPDGAFAKPARELRAFAKTQKLLPGESQDVSSTFCVDDLAYFNPDESAYMAEAGEYIVFCGTDVRSAAPCGRFVLSESKFIRRVSLQFTPHPSHLMNRSGEFEKTAYYDAPKGEKAKKVFSAGDEGHIQAVNAEPETKSDAPTGYSLIQVDEGKLSLADFVHHLTDEQLIHLCQAQPPAFTRGTAGIGNLPELGIPNVQTADGPAGIRRTVPTTCLPCPSCLACTWDLDLITRAGTALGEDGIANGIDIVLAPAMNIHRHPLCGRNFEYYSEDPLLSGLCSASMIQGIQSRGLGATVKHFALNNRETNRYFSNSVASERAIREIYLEGFRIAVTKGKPWCVMTSYNLLNNVRTSANRNLLTGVLREEWGFDGMVMTDWRVPSHMFEELLSGGNIKMPYGYPEELALTTQRLRERVLTRSLLEHNAVYILRTIMKTHRFKMRDFGEVHPIQPPTVLPAIAFTGVSLTWARSDFFKDGTEYVGNLGLDQRNRESFIYYRIRVSEDLNTRLRLRVACVHEGIQAKIFLDGVEKAKINCLASSYQLDTPFYTDYAALSIPAGEHELKIHFANTQCMDCLNLAEIDFK